MIDLTRSAAASHCLHRVPTDPGTCWTKDAVVAIDAPPDSDHDPAPDAKWPPDSRRTGLCGAVSPRVVSLPRGGFRMYYTQILPRPGFPAGANDYENSTTRILSAVSQDGFSWTPEPGVRLSAEAGGAGEFRVVSSEVVPVGDGRQMRMYYECCRGTHSEPNTIRSAVSEDGLTWRAEPGVRLGSVAGNYASPRILILDDGRVRLYCLERGRGIVSALSKDDGLTFEQEAGVRIAPGGVYDTLVAFAPEILVVENQGYLMYYAGYSTSSRAQILRASSDDGLQWRKHSEPALLPGPGGLDAAKCSEMCLFMLRRNGNPRPAFRMLYEACDGTAVDARGVWRILGANSSV